MKTLARKVGKKMMHVVAAMAVMMCIMLLDENTIISEAADIKLNSNAKVRSEASTSSNVVGNAASGATFSLLGEVTGGDGYVWYQVSVNGATGYIRSDLAEKVSGGMTQAEVERENSYTETSATVSETSVSSGKISVDSANVRKGPSSTDAPVTSVKSGTEVAISGEAIGADGNVWYQVSVNGKTGFVRSDLVEAAEAEEPEESENPEEEEEEEEENSEEEEISEDAGTIEISNVISSRILPGDVDLADMTIDEALLEEWKSGNFYVLYTTDPDNNEKWYLYSLKDNQIEEIDSLQGDGESTESSLIGSLIEGNNKIILLIVAALFIVLILVCILLALKLHEYREYYEDDEDDDDEDDEDDEDEDEDEDDEDEDDDEDDDDEDERPRRKSRWSPKNFLSRRDEDDDDDDDDDEEDEDDEDDDDEDEEYLDDDDFEFEFLNMDGKDKFR